MPEEVSEPLDHGAVTSVETRSLRYASSADRQTGVPRPTPGRIETSAPTKSEPWILSAALILLLFPAVLCALYWGILRDLGWQWWDDPNYSHGFLVPLFSGFVVWQRWDQLRAVRPEGSSAGLLVLIAGIGALLLGDLSGENFLTRCSMIAVLSGLIIFHLGRRI